MWFLSLWEFHLNWIDNLWVNSGIHLKSENVINEITINHFDTHQEILRNIYFFIPKTWIVVFFTLFMLFMGFRIVFAIISFVVKSKGAIGGN